MTGALMLSSTLAGYLVSTMLRSVHLIILGMAFGPVDTIFTVTGILALMSGIYALFSLRKLA